MIIIAMVILISFSLALLLVCVLLLAAKRQYDLRRDKVCVLIDLANEMSKEELHDGADYLNACYQVELERGRK